MKWIWFGPELCVCIHLCMNTQSCRWRGGRDPQGVVEVGRIQALSLFWKTHATGRSISAPDGHATLRFCIFILVAALLAAAQTPRVWAGNHQVLDPSAELEQSPETHQRNTGSAVRTEALQFGARSKSSTLGVRKNEVSVLTLLFQIYVILGSLVQFHYLLSARLDWALSRCWGQNCGKKTMSVSLKTLTTFPRRKIFKRVVRLVPWSMGGAEQRVLSPVGVQLGLDGLRGVGGPWAAPEQASAEQMWEEGLSRSTTWPALSPPSCWRRALKPESKFFNTIPEATKTCGCPRQRACYGDGTRHVNRLDFFPDSVSCLFALHQLVFFLGVPSPLKWIQAMWGLG